MPPLSEGLCQGGLFSESQRRDYGQAAGRGKPRGLGSQGPSAGGRGGLLHPVPPSSSVGRGSLPRFPLLRNE